MPVTNLMHKFLYSYNVTVHYMFRTVLCSSSGGQIVCTQYIVSSLSMSGRDGRRTTAATHRVTIPYAVYIQFDLLRMSVILL
jgi:hypothetical protein